MIPATGMLIEEGIEIVIVDQDDPADFRVPQTLPTPIANSAGALVPTLRHLVDVAPAPGNR
jgi:hypothetical protein